MWYEKLTYFSVLQAVSDHGFRPSVDTDGVLPMSRTVSQVACEFCDAQNTQKKSRQSDSFGSAPSLGDGLMNPLQHLAMKALARHPVVAFGPICQAEVAIEVLSPHQHGKRLAAAALPHLGRDVADGQPDSGDVGVVGLRAVHDPQVVH